MPTYTVEVMTGTLYILKVSAPNERIAREAGEAHIFDQTEISGKAHIVEDDYGEAHTTAKIIRPSRKK